MDCVNASSSSSEEDRKANAKLAFLRSWLLKKRVLERLYDTFLLRIVQHSFSNKTIGVSNALTRRGVQFEKLKTNWILAAFFCLFGTLLSSILNVEDL